MITFIIIVIVFVLLVGMGSKNKSGVTSPPKYLIREQPIKLSIDLNFQKSPNILVMLSMSFWILRQLAYQKTMMQNQKI
jgi:uncharacterized membrane protein YciS (DUF1049 family)